MEDMRKAVGLLIVYFLLCSVAFGQVHRGAFNPFGFVADDVPGVKMAKDTTGLVWFAGTSLMQDTVFITNQNHSAWYTIANHSLASWQCDFIVDKQNDIWLNSGADSIIRIHQGILQSINIPGFPYWNATDNTSYYCLVIADDHNGNDYILGDYSRGNFPQSDSLVLTKFDGSGYTQIPMGPWAGQQQNNQLGQNMFSDYAGNIFVMVDTTNIHKYSNGVWSNIVTDHNDAYSAIFSTYSSQLLADDLMRNIDSLSATGQSQSIYNAGVYGLQCSNLFYANDSTLWLACGNGLLQDSAGTFVVKVAPSVAGRVAYEDCNYNTLMDKYGNFFSSVNSVVYYYSPSGFSAIAGRAFIDTNTNGIQDSGEVGVAGLIVNELTTGYRYNTDSGGNYTVTYINPDATSKVSLNCPDYYRITTPALYDVYPDSAGFCCFNFGITPAGNVQDLQVCLASSSAIPGNQSMQWLSYKNNGNTIVSDTITYLLAPEYSYQGSTPTANVVEGHLLKWAYADLKPFETRVITLRVQLDSSVLPGTFVNDTAVIYPLATDTTPGNNMYALQQQVTTTSVSAEKIVLPAGNVGPGQVLTYTIYFQNTDTAPVRNILINDTLSAYLNAETFKITGYSWPVNYQLGAHGVVQFTFNNIQLPDSQANAAGSVGYVQYSVATNTNIYWGNKIYNTGHITFGLNPPVATNTTYNYFLPDGITEVPPIGMLHVYPNPNNGAFTVENNSATPATELSLLDISGREVLSQHLLTGKSAVSITGLNSGVYVLLATGANGIVARVKVVIE